MIGHSTYRRPDLQHDYACIWQAGISAKIIEDAYTELITRV
jgi:hypothetical protein